MKEKLKINHLILILLIVLWISVTTSIQRFKNPQLTETELFLKIPDSFLLKFN